MKFFDFYLYYFHYDIVYVFLYELELVFYIIAHKTVHLKNWLNQSESPKENKTKQKRNNQKTAFMSWSVHKQPEAADHTSVDTLKS